MSSYYEKFLAAGEVKCIDDEIPFEIPATWEWARINTIGISQLGKTLDRGKNIGQDTPYLCSINVYWDGIDLSKIKTFKLRDDELPKYRLHKGDLLICEGGDYGRCCVWDRDEEMYYQNALHRIRFYCGLFPIFYKFVFELYRNIGYIVGQGQTIKHFTYESMKSIVFPVPSISEQKRIVELLKEVLYLVKRYDKKQDALNYLNERINVKLQKSILKEAIQGKLVPQIAEEGTAEKLLAEIRKEKERLVKEGKLKKSVLSDSVIYKGDDNKYFEKKGKIVTDITDEIPFEIPTTWQWVRIRDIFQINPKNTAEDSSISAFIPMEKICATYGSEYSYEEVQWKTIKTGYTHFADGDVAFAKITPCFQNRKSAIFKNLPNGIGAGTTELKVLRQFGETINRWYLLFFLESSYFIDEATFKGTANQQRIVSGYLENKLFPLPPLKGQERMVSKIEQLASIMRG